MTQPKRIPSATPAGDELPKPKPHAEVGVSSHLPFVTPYANQWEVLRHDEVTVAQLAAMRRSDGQARALYRLITLPIRAALKTCTFVPGEGVEGGEEEAEFIQRLLTLPAAGGGMSVSFDRIIAQMLLAIFDGFSAFEMVYQSPKSGPLKGKWALEKLAHRPGDTLTFVLDERSECVGLRQQTMYQNQHIDRLIPADHAVWYTAQEEERPFYGQSYFQSAFFHWDKKFKLYVIVHLAAQRAAVGTRVGKLPKNPNREEKAAFQKALADLGAAQWMTIPEDYLVESLREATNFDFLSLINHHNSQMSKSILAAFFDKEQGGGADSGKLVDFGQQSDSLFLLMLQTIMGEIEDVINNKVIPRFIRWNFNNDKYPQFRFGSLSQEQKSAMLDLFKQLAVAGQSLTIRPEIIHEMSKQISEEFGLEIDWETVEEDMAFDAEQQALAEEQQAQESMLGDGGAPPVIDGSILPEGFVLSHLDDTTLALTGLARDLYREAVGLTRGVPGTGGPKYVRTPAGAKVYGVPIGTPITRDMEHRAGNSGGQGKVFGGGVRQPNGPKAAPSDRAGGGAGDANTGRQLLGGGPGARAQDIGGVVTDPHASDAEAQQVLGHPDAPGAQLLDYGDGTVAIRDAEGNMSARQRFQISKFLSLGWVIARGDGTGNTREDDAGSKSGSTRAAQTGGDKRSVSKDNKTAGKPGTR